MRDVIRKAIGRIGEGIVHALGVMIPSPLNTPERDNLGEKTKQPTKKARKKPGKS